MNTTHFSGLDGSVWFIGVVEDNNDPDKLGRVKVRAYGHHTNDLSDIPLEYLPWATSHDRQQMIPQCKELTILVQ